MTNSEQAIRELADKWGFSQDKTDEGFLIDNDRTKQCLSDLTALISEHSILYHKWLQKKGYTNIKHSHKECIEEYLTELERNEGN